MWKYSQKASELFVPLFPVTSPVALPLALAPGPSEGFLFLIRLLPLPSGPAAISKELTAKSLFLPSQRYFL